MELSPEERKFIDAWMPLKKYFEAIIHDLALENALFDGRKDVELFRFKRVEDKEWQSAEERKSVDIVYGVDGIGFYRHETDPSLFHQKYYFRWGRDVEPLPLAVSIARDSNCTVTPDTIEAKLALFRPSK